MKIGIALSIISSLFGFFGSIRIAKSLLKLTPDIIAEESLTIWGFNLTRLKSIASQKADAVSGVYLILPAFLVQIVKLIVLECLNWDSKFLSKSFSLDFQLILSASIIITFIILFLFLFLPKILRKKYEKSAKKSLATMHLQKALGEKTLNIESIENYAKDVLGIKRENDEADGKFLKRYANYLGVDLPNNIDIKKIEARFNRR